MLLIELEKDKVSYKNFFRLHHLEIITEMKKNELLQKLIQQATKSLAMRPLKIK